MPPGLGDLALGVAGARASRRAARPSRSAWAAPSACCCDFVARPTSTSSRPVANGSSVPAWPGARARRSARRTRATTSCEVIPAGLSISRMPSGPACRSGERGGGVAVGARVQLRGDRAGAGRRSARRAPATSRSRRRGGARRRPARARSPRRRRRRRSRAARLCAARGRSPRQLAHEHRDLRARAARAAGRRRPRSSCSSASARAKSSALSAASVSSPSSKRCMRPSASVEQRRACRRACPRTAGGRRRRTSTPGLDQLGGHQVRPRAGVLVHEAARVGDQPDVQRLRPRPASGARPGRASGPTRSPPCTRRRRRRG